MFEKYWQTEGFVPIPLSDRFFFINDTGVIVDKAGEKIDTTVDEDDHICVFVNLWKGWAKYRVVDLMAFVFKRINIHHTLLDRIDGFCIDGDKKNLHARNVGYRFKNGPLEVPFCKGFYYIPFFTKYGITPAGDFRKLSPLGDIKKWSITKANQEKRIKGGYRYCGLTSDVGKPTNLARHRALGLVFLPYPDNVDKLDINHIDGIPGSDDLSNLEWATRSRNIYHAMEMGFMNAIPVLVRNVATKEVNEYYSIAEAARVLGLACDEAVRFRLRQPFGTVFQGGVQVKYKNDERPWVEIDDPEKAMLEARQQIPVACRNVLTGDQFYTHSITEAAELMKMTIPVVSLRLRRGMKTAVDGWQFQYAEGQTLVWEDVKPEDVKWMPKMLPVERHDIETGEVLVFKSKNAASKSVAKGGPLSTYLCKGFQPLYHGRYRFKYQKDDWREPDMIDYGSIVDSVLIKLPNRGSTANSTWAQQTQ